MVARRSPGKREYPAVVFLLHWVTDSRVWTFFDGWCTSQGIYHEAIPWYKWLNLVYYFAVRNASTEDRQKFDNAIQDQVTAWNRAKLKPVIEQARENPTPTPGQRTRRMPPKPAGWGDNTTNTFNSKAAIKTLTAGGVSGKARRK